MTAGVNLLNRLSLILFLAFPRNPPGVERPSPENSNGPYLIGSRDLYYQIMFRDFTHSGT